MHPRLRRTAVLALLLPVLARGEGALEAAQHVPEDSYGPAGELPADVDLQRRGARIGRVLIQVDAVFDEPGRLAAPYRLANGLHVPTQEETVQRQLLFQRGDPYDPRLLAESERLLRSQAYLNEAVVRPVAYSNNEIDVLVRVHDVWTLSPGISLGRRGGENSARLKFEDANFLGRGKQASIAAWRDVDRSAWRIAYDDPNLLGSRWQLSSAYASMTDGEERAFAVQRPFYSLGTSWSAGIAAADTTSAVARYSLGDVQDRFDMNEQIFALSGGMSAGLEGRWAKRYLGGVRSVSRTFSARPDDPLAASVLPEDRTLVYPWVGIEVIEDDYVRTRNLDQIGRTEDLYLGSRGRIELGFAPTALGSTRDAFILGGALQAGTDLGDEQFWISSLEASGRVEDGALVNATLSLNSRYYLRHTERRVSFASLSTKLASRADPEEQLLLGGDNGLRGFPLRYQAGTASTLFTLEERFYTAWQPLKLVDVGAAIFVDAGRTWDHAGPAAARAGWLTDAGCGLRLGNARSALGNVLHIDLAFPLGRPSDIDSVQLLIATRKSF